MRTIPIFIDMKELVNQIEERLNTLSEKSLPIIFKWIERFVLLGLIYGVVMMIYNVFQEIF